MTDPDTLTDTAAVRTGAGAILGLRQAVTASGPDTVGFLQGQLSQDIEGMAPRESRWTLLLHPQGKISAWLRVTRLGDDAFFLDVDAGWADEVVSRLERFKLRTKCDLAVSELVSLTVVGRQAFEVPIEGAEVEVHDSWAGLPVVVAFGVDPTAEAPTIDADVVTTLRIESGRPAMGTELDESTIPAAAGLVERSVSFTKGCYTGQELVARIDSRGNNVPRRLVGVVFDEAASPQVGQDLLIGDQVVGQLTSVGVSAELGAPVAMGYATRAVEAGAAVTVGSADAVVRELPLVS